MVENKKVLCVIDYLCAGGAQRQLVNMSIEFKKRGYDVEFLVYHEHDFFKSVLDENKIRINLVSTTNYLMRLIKMRIFIRGFKPHIVISFLEAASFIAELSSLPFKKFTLIVGERNANPNILRSFKLKFYRQFHYLADYVVSNSTLNIDLVKRINPLLPFSKYRVIYNMVDFEKWKPNLEHQYLVDGKFRLVVLARYHVSKNLIGLLKAIDQLDHSNKEKLIIDWYGEIGDSSYSDGVNFIVNKGLEKIINLHKECKNVLPLIQNADCVGLFSFYEGLPNAICESMSVGKPVMYSDVSDLPKIINNANFCFSPEKTNEIVNTLNYFLNLSSIELKNIGLNNRNIALQTFSKDQVVSSYIDLF